MSTHNCLAGTRSDVPKHSDHSWRHKAYENAIHAENTLYNSYNLLYSHLNIRINLLGNSSEEHRSANKSE